MSRNHLHQFQGLLARAVRVTVVVAVAGAFGTSLRPEGLSASGSECGWECKGLKCKEDREYPDIRCEEEVPNTCTNFACEPDPS